MGGFALGTAVVCIGLILSLELGAWSYNLIAGTLAAMTVNRTTQMTDANLEAALAQLRKSSSPALRIEALHRLEQFRNRRVIEALKLTHEAGSRAYRANVRVVDPTLTEERLQLMTDVAGWRAEELRRLVALGVLVASDLDQRKARTEKGLRQRASGSRPVPTCFATLTVIARLDSPGRPVPQSCDRVHTFRSGPSAIMSRTAVDCYR